MARAPRWYQSKLEQEIYAAWAEGHTDVLAVLATGGGKTFVFCRIVAAYAGVSLIVAHRQELVVQSSLTLAEHGIRHRVIGSDATRQECIRAQLDEYRHHFVDPGARVVVAGVDTLVLLPDDDPLWQQCGLYVTDEGHHLLRENKWGKARVRATRAVGLSVTATAGRPDGKGLGRKADGFADVLIEGPGMRQLIDEGHLCDYRIAAPKSTLDLSAVTLSDSGDYSPPKLAAAVHKSSIQGDIVEHYLRLVPGRLALVFAVDIKAAVKIMEGLRAAGVRAEVAHGKTPNRAALMRRFRRREFEVLVSVDILGEGTDIPAVEVVIFGRPTASYIIYAQQFGRALRLLAGKEFAQIIDHVGNVDRHGLPDAYRRWSLNRRERAVRGAPSELVPVKTCLNPLCLLQYERVLDACPYCEHVNAPAARGGPREVDGVLDWIDPEILAQMRGDVAAVEAPPSINPHWDAAIIGSVKKAHRNRLEVRRQMLEAFALWMGWRVGHQGKSQHEAERRFYTRYGIDMLSAQALDREAAEKLVAQVVAELNEHGIIARKEN